MFGTNYPCLQFDDALQGVDELGLDAETKELLLYENARRVFGLERA